MDQVAQVREKIDIVSLLSEFLPLKKAGRNFKANCPFHNEKTPSFVVSPERQIWHCFGCNLGGDAFTFLMEYEHIDFPEAFKTLAKRAGIELISTQFETVSSSKKEKIYKLNKTACEFYHYVLTSHKAGKKALEYIHNRKIKDAVIKTFMVGFAPATGNALTAYLITKKKYLMQDIVEAGLGFTKGRDTVDFFRNRIMFPLFDHRDNIVGFSGRVLTESEFSPKYINTRDTLVYHKGELFFGIQIAKPAIKKENQTLIVEGEFDVISCFQVGIGNAIAIKGTALTEQQAKLLSRFTEKVTICFDGDLAGQQAIKRSLSVLEKKGLTTTVVVITNGKDPDESIKNDEYAFKHAVKHDIGIYDYLLDVTLKKYNMSSAEGKKKITDELLPVLEQIENEIVKEHFLKKLSIQLNTSYESIMRELERRTSGKKTQLLHVVRKEKKSREEKLEEYIVSLIVQGESPKDLFLKASAILIDVLPKDRAFQKILYYMNDYILTHQQFNGKQFSVVLPQELLQAYDTCFVFPIPQFKDGDTYTNEVEKTAKELKTFYIRSRIKNLTQRIRQKETEGDLVGLEKLQKEFSSLVLQLESA